MNQSQNNFTFIDLLNFIIIFLQLKTELKLDRQASNNDLLGLLDEIKKIGASKKYLPAPKHYQNCTVPI